MLTYFYVHIMYGGRRTIFICKLFYLTFINNNPEENIHNLSNEI